jgi:hypothetical protein
MRKNRLEIPLAENNGQVHLLLKISARAGKRPVQAEFFRTGSVILSAQVAGGMNNQWPLDFPRKLPALKKSGPNTDGVHRWRIP